MHRLCQHVHYPLVGLFDQRVGQLMSIDQHLELTLLLLVEGMLDDCECRWHLLFSRLNFRHDFDFGGRLVHKVQASLKLLQWTYFSFALTPLSLHHSGMLEYLFPAYSLLRVLGQHGLNHLIQIIGPIVAGDCQS